MSTTEQTAPKADQKTGRTVHTLSLSDVFRMLRGTRVFSGLDNESLVLFGDALEGVSFDPGDVLVREGERRFGLNIILRGTADVVLTSASDSGKAYRKGHIVLGNLRSGDCFGEYSIFDDRPASATVRATRDGELVHIRQERLRAILDGDDRIARTVYRNLLTIMIERLRASANDMEVLLSGKGDTQS